MDTLTTATAIANAATGTGWEPHEIDPDQVVHRCTSTYSGILGPCHVVLVDGQTYEVRERTLRLLEAGVTPEALDLEPFEEDEDSDPFDGDYCHADHFRAVLRTGRTA